MVVPSADPSDYLSLEPLGRFTYCTNLNEKAFRERQTLRAGCSKAEPKNFAPPQTLSGGAGPPKFNQLETVTTCTYRPGLVKIDARNFELSW